MKGADENQQREKDRQDSQHAPRWVTAGVSMGSNMLSQEFRHARTGFDDINDTGSMDPQMYSAVTPRIIDLRPRLIATVALMALTSLGGCGPVHPRWRNASSHDITVNYVRGASIVRKAVAAGGEGIPPAFFDFAKVERIEIEDTGRKYSIGRRDVARLHDECGHGYRCRIEYYGPRHIAVSRS
ncbi:hypothetical protein [Sphingomonas sp.]|uniref:hypothetical protein n=1 Tax=Sphingomonas sp. TaxID=28214 RepID=UPI00257BFEF9|nr:hypothetical protein [Sphingomonas sp.]